MDIHSTDESNRRAALALGMLLDEREGKIAEAHDKDVWYSRFVVVEEFCEKRGWKLGTSEDGHYMQMVPIDDENLQVEPSTEQEYKDEIDRLQETVSKLKKDKEYILSTIFEANNNPENVVQQGVE